MWGLYDGLRHMRLLRYVRVEFDLTEPAAENTHQVFDRQSVSQPKNQRTKNPFSQMKRSARTSLEVLQLML